ncbi:molecular chaperone HtpG [Actinoplanes sp. NPDC051513]|uniref:molecular chaperone HtpG n=1 Tax=Actinoplanes sp. NPDC051513 TaxID=3363908 RepID=UPI0037B634F6
METLEFQAEARQLLQLMVHSIYSNKDIFLRELISNSSDALDKLRLATLQDGLEADTSDLHIEIEVDAEARTLTVRDNGIGMTHEEVVDLIGTIAKSGTADLLAKLKEATEARDTELIGQFGVGFYSTFMVADRVSLVTRKAGTEGHGTMWESAGEGTYTIDDAPDAPVGTTVTLHLRPKDEEDRLFDYAADWKIKEIVKRYSDFISFPIRMVSADKADETLNSMKALWARPRSEVSDDEYHQFYRHISHDWSDPLEIINMKAEGTFEYEALLFLPSRAPHDLFQRDARRGLQLYVKRVFIMDDSKELIPDYLRFVKGVVDAADLSLNISREILQQDRHIQMIRRRLVKKVLSTIKDMLSNNREKYETFWREFGRALKEGLLNDPDNQKAILDVATFSSTASKEEPTTLAAYVERMKDGQEEIYYLTGESRSQVENSPHMEAFEAQGYEVLILTDPVDEIWVEAVPDYDGKKLQSIARGNVDLPKDKEEPEPEGDFGPLLGFLKEKLDENVKEVRLSHRLTTSAACLVSDTDDITPTLEKMYRAMGQEGPRVKRILELNPNHPLVGGLRAAHERAADDPALPETAELLYGTALLAEGGDLEDPARFAKLLADRLARTV